MRHLRNAVLLVVLAVAIAWVSTVIGDWASTTRSVSYDPPAPSRAVQYFVILVGRGANLITASLPRVFHVRLIAPLPERIERVARQVVVEHRTEKGADEFLEPVAASGCEQRFTRHVRKPQLAEDLLHLAAKPCVNVELRA